MSTTDKKRKNWVKVPKERDIYINLICKKCEKIIDHTKEFLVSYAGSADTFNSYRREVERLLHWSWLIKKKLLKEISRNDIRDYLEFTNNPPQSWIATKTVSRFNEKSGERLPNPEWRPYVVRVSKVARYHGKTPDIHDYSLSNKSIQALFSTLSTYFTYLQQEEY